MALLLRPGTIRAVLPVVFAVALVERSGSYLGWWRFGPNPNAAFALLMAAAYAAALVLCWKIAQDHKGSRAMRVAWLLFAGSAGLSIVRHALQSAAAAGAFDALAPHERYLLAQIPMALALVLLFGGLTAMWRAFSGLGLGFHPRRIDVLLMSAMVLMLPPILNRYAERLPSLSPDWAWVLPVSGALFLPACAGMALLLHRVAMETNGGETARFLRLLIWFPGIRLVAMLASVEPLLKSIPPVAVFGYALYQVAPLVFTLGVACRWQITLHATAAILAEADLAARESASESKVFS